MKRLQVIDCGKVTQIRYCKREGEAVYTKKMMCESISIREASFLPQAGAMESEAQWYAIYVRSRHEKYVREQCQRQEIRSFLPLYERVSRWKDRKVRVRWPIFPGYLFVRIALERCFEVMQIPGVVCLVGFGGHPAALREEEIETLERGLRAGICAKPHPYVKLGRRVRIARGPLAGLEGTAIRQRGSLRVVLAIDLLQRSVSVDADIADLEPIHRSVAGLSPAEVRGSDGQSL